MAGGEQRLIIAGGGLAGCLAALALQRLRPDVPFLLVEGGQSFGGNHVWSFFDPDVDENALWLVEPMIARSWTGYSIAFPKRRRALGTTYNSTRSELLDQTMRERLRPERYRLGARIEALAPDHALLADGERVEALGVVDARGASELPGLSLGWQKFVGREYLFERPHGLDRPIIMDATVDQAEGYRFVYCLPFDERRMLVEDTYYSLSPALDVAALGQRIEDYVAAEGWGPARLEKQETGVLPVAMGGGLDGLWAGDVPKLGLRGGFFHPTTGYSLPDAVRTALLLAEQKDFRTSTLLELFRGEAMRLWRERRFYRLLNKMLFRAADPAGRYRVLEHFYRLDEQLIARFYAGRSNLADKARILSGKPPVPIGRAVRALLR